MSNSLDEPISQCGCGTGQIKSTIACPVCRKLGSTVKFITPQHTVRKSARPKLDPELDYHFCDNPDCDVAYYNEQNTSVITVEGLKNRVTVKDESPETPLCYCFKVLKKQALEEIARTGTTNVFHSIQAKMKPGQSCFCEKANPRGDTCAKDIKDWLESQGVSSDSNPEHTVNSDNGCCGGQPATEKSDSGCCG